MCVGLISGSSLSLVPLACISVLCQYHTILMTVALQYSLKSAAFLSCKIFSYPSPLVQLSRMVKKISLCILSRRDNSQYFIIQQEAFCLFWQIVSIRVTRVFLFLAKIFYIGNVLKFLKISKMLFLYLLRYPYDYSPVVFQLVLFSNIN